LLTPVDAAVSAPDAHEHRVVAAADFAERFEGLNSATTSIRR